MASLLIKRDKLIIESFTVYGLDHDLVIIRLDEVNMDILRLKFNSRRG
jgi:hypothetical protein